MLLRRAFLAALAGPLLAAGAAAQDYPTRAIKLAVPFAAGSATDAVARIYGEALTAELKQPVVVENMPGASGVLAAQAVARAAPDGYTLLVTTNTTHGANQSLLARVPYDAVKDFAPLTRLGTNPLVLLVTPDLPARTVAELVAYAKANPGKLTFGSGSSSSRVSGELLKARTGADIAHVPFRSIPPAVTAVIGGQISMAFADPQSGLPQVAGGKARALAVTGRTRLRNAPDVPTMEEAGVPNYDIVAWFGAFAPAGTPAPIVARLQKVLSDAARREPTANRLLAAGIEPDWSTSAELAGHVEAEIAKWAEIVAAAGIKPE